MNVAKHAAATRGDAGHGAPARRHGADHGDRPGRGIRRPRVSLRHRRRRWIRSVEHRAPPGHDRRPHRDRERAGRGNTGAITGAAAGVAAAAGTAPGRERGRRKGG
ncbi:MAG: hypothetical protein MZW92_38150 [Comamonadaceae bacterium]|nr:hypothetical protein [Comamonadaceae bacterium]